MESRKLDHEHAAPLLEDDERESQDIELADLHDPLNGHPRPPRQSFESSHEPPIPAVPKNTASYLAIAIVLTITVMGFMINTEATAYFEDILGWKKPFCTMYIMHSTLCLPWFGHVGWSRYKQRHIPYKAWVRDYNNKLRELVASVDAYATSGPRLVWKWKGQVAGPLDFLASTMLIVTAVLTVSGCSWFLSLALTTPADLTAIYNCSTFFAAAFSVPLLKEKLSWIAIGAVAMSIVGTFVIAYGDTTAEHDESAVGTSRLLGNLVASIGAVAFGLYEVLFKKWACSSRPMNPSESLPLTFAASALTGIYTFATLWLLLVVLHFTGVETFVWPGAYVALWIMIAVVSGSSKYITHVCSRRTDRPCSIHESSGRVSSVDRSHLRIYGKCVSTNPHFQSNSAHLSDCCRLTVFFVALADWVVFGLSPSIATYVGGALIMVAFTMLAKDTLGEKKKH